MREIAGITVSKEDKCCLICVENFSEEIKEMLKNRLVAICHGDNRAANEPQLYPYGIVTKQLWEKIQNKEEKDRMGIVAELLAHLLIKEVHNSFQTLSAFFNLEDNGFKKAFDVNFYCNEEKKAWFTEVKSGLKGTDNSKDEKIKSLFSLAKSDLKKRIEKPSSNSWQNAINHLDLSAIQSNPKSALKEILSKGFHTSFIGQNQANTYNAILVGVLFHEVSEKIDFNVLKKVHDDINKQNTFNETIVFAFQKSTFVKVINFLQQESAHGTN